MSFEIDKEAKEEGVKRKVFTAHLVRREMLGKVLCEHLLSSHPLAMKGFTYPLPMGGSVPKRGTGSVCPGTPGTYSRKESKGTGGCCAGARSWTVLSEGKLCPTVYLPLMFTAW